MSSSSDIEEYMNHPHKVRPLFEAQGEVKHFAKVKKVKASIVGTWDWRHDGSHKSGQIVFHEDATTEWVGGERFESWRLLKGHRIFTHFNGVDHVMSLSKDRKTLVLIEPVRFPPSTATFVSCNTGDEEEDAAVEGSIYKPFDELELKEYERDDVRVTAEHDIEGGGTGQEFCHNVISAGEEDWDKWLYDAPNSWITIDFKGRQQRAIGGIGIKSANDCPERDPKVVRIYAHDNIQNRWVHLCSHDLNFDEERWHVVKFRIPTVTSSAFTFEFESDNDAGQLG